MREKNIIVIIFLLIAIILISYHSYFSDNGSNSSVTVIINDEGFSPEKITVSKGTTITWVNEGEHNHWPASNFHPTHTLYPEKGGCLGSKFDACKGLVKGEAYSFQFDILGKWSVHDHLFPGLLMTVEVSDKQDFNNEDIFIYNEKTKVEDFRNFDYSRQLDFIKFISKDSPVKAWSYVKEAFVINNQVVGNAHEFAHIVGHGAYEKLGINGVKICDNTFAFGCFHGVTEAMLLKEGVNSVKSIELECLKLFPPDKSQDYTGCIHGSGHGLFGLENGNLKKALSGCDIISEPYRQYCYDGVFMENSFSAESKVFDQKNPWKFCTDLDERYHRNCARYQSQIFLGKFGISNSMNLVGKNCALGPSVLLRETCYESLGYYTAQTNLGKVADIMKSCKQMPSIEGVEICTTGGAIESVFQKYTNFKDSANELCKSLAELRRSTCLSRINSMIQPEEDFSNSIKTQAITIRDFCLDPSNLSKAKGKENCYNEQFNSLAEKSGPEFSFKVLETLQGIDPETQGCHLIAHGMGYGLYKRDPNNWRALIQNMPPICNYGAIHGVIESYINSLPDKSLKRDIVPAICGDRPRADCNHIVGHLLLVQTDADVSKALDLCEVFTDIQQNSFCISGVFMEYQTALNLVAHDLVPESWLNWPPRLGELEKLCRSYNSKFAEGCWEEIVHVAAVAFNNDPKKIWDLCSTAQVPNGAKRCRYHSIGIIGASKNFNLASLKSICRIPQKNNAGFEAECYPALVSSALSTIPEMVPQAVSFCRSLEDKFQASCFSMVDTMKQNNYNNIRNND